MPRPVTPTAIAVAPAFDPATFSLRLELVADGLNSPVFATHAGDGSGRLFVVEKKGQIRVLDADGPLKQPFLDIRKRVGSGSSEQGLLGLAFHPNFGQNGRLFVYYTDKKGNTVISRFQANAERTEADPASEVVLLTQEQPASNHNGGMLAFGPDGMLYAGLGDGGGADDHVGQRPEAQHTAGQNPAHRRGQRRDRRGAGRQSLRRPRGRAAGNVGLRSAQSLALLASTGRPATCGSPTLARTNGRRVNFQPAASRGGENYGWSIMEGTHCYDAKTCDQSRPGAAGGRVWPRRQRLLRQRRLRLPWCGPAESCRASTSTATTAPARIRGLAKDAGGQWQSAELLDTDLQISSFGETEDGEVLVVMTA